MRVLTSCNEQLEQRQPWEDSSRCCWGSVHKIRFKHKCLLKGFSPRPTEQYLQEVTSGMVRKFSVKVAMTMSDCDRRWRRTGWCWKRRGREWLSPRQALSSREKLLRAGGGCGNPGCQGSHSSGYILCFSSSSWACVRAIHTILNNHVQCIYFSLVVGYQMQTKPTADVGLFFSLGKFDLSGDFLMQVIEGEFV